MDNIEITGIKLALQHITSTSSVTTANSLTVKMISTALDLITLDTALDSGGTAAVSDPGAITFTLDDVPYLSNPPQDSIYRLAVGEMMVLELGEAKSKLENDNF